MFFSSWGAVYIGYTKVTHNVQSLSDHMHSFVRCSDLFVGFMARKKEKRGYHLLPVRWGPFRLKINLLSGLWLYLVSFLEGDLGIFFWGT